MISEIQDFNLRGLNTMRMDVHAAFYISFTEEYEAQTAWEIAKNVNPDRSPVILGGGSNILFTDDYPGAVIHPLLRDWEALPIGNSTVELTLGAAVSLDEAAARCCSSGLWGLENLSGIPGTVGGATVQNAGAYGTDLSAVVKSVKVYDTERNSIRILDKETLDYGYRTSVFKQAQPPRFIVLSTTLTLSEIPVPVLTYGPLKKLAGLPDGITPGRVREAVLEIRASKLPDVESVGSAGSYFKNPVLDESAWKEFTNLVEKSGTDVSTVPCFELESGEKKVPAAWLIEKSGWKNRSLGNASTWHTQPLIIVNATGKAAPQEIIALEESIKKDVLSKFGVRLSPEVVKV